jgi:hypothetical protein
MLRIARQLADGDRRTAGFQTSGKAIERFYPVSDPRIEGRASFQSFLCPSRDPIQLVVQPW